MEIQKSKTHYLDFIMFVIFIFLISKDAYNFLLNGNWRNAVLYSLYIYFILRILVVTLLEKKSLHFNKYIVGIVLLILLSAFWSIDTNNTIISTINHIILPTLVIIFMGSYYRIITILKVTFLSGALMVTSSFLILIIDPSIGIKSDGYVSYWTGIFTNKNLLANSSSFHFMIAIFLFFYIKNKNSRLLYITFAFAHIIMMFLANSSTGILVTLLTLLIPITIFIIYRIKNAYLLISSIIFYIIFFVLGLLTFLLLLDGIVDFLGKDLTFTGRTIVWEIVLEVVKERPLLGYGYGVFWEIGSPTFNYVNGIIGVLSSHNGFLDILTSIGLLGLVFIIITILVYTKRNISLLLIKKDSLFILPLMYLVYLITYNTQESFFIEQNFIMWVFFVYFFNVLSLENKNLYNSVVSREN